MLACSVRYAHAKLHPRTLIIISLHFYYKKICKKVFASVNIYKQHAFSSRYKKVQSNKFTCARSEHTDTL